MSVLLWLANSPDGILRRTEAGPLVSGRRQRGKSVLGVGFDPVREDIRSATEVSFLSDTIGVRALQRG